MFDYPLSGSETASCITLLDKFEDIPDSLPSYFGLIKRDCLSLSIIDFIYNLLVSNCMSLSYALSRSFSLIDLTSDTSEFIS